MQDEIRLIKDQLKVITQSIVEMVQYTHTQKHAHSVYTLHTYTMYLVNTHTHVNTYTMIKLAMNFKYKCSTTYSHDVPK